MNLKRTFLLMCIALLIGIVAGCSNQKYPQGTVFVMKDTIVTEEMIKTEMKEREISLDMRNKLDELWPSEKDQTPKETILMVLNIKEKDLNAEQRRYFDYLNEQDELLDENKAFNNIVREEAMYQQAVKQGFLVTEDRARKILEEANEVSRKLMSEKEETKKEYEKILELETAVFKGYGFKSREDYWFKWHLPKTAKASTITLMQNSFNEKIQELKPNLESYSLWIEQYNAWEDYTEYLLDRSNIKVLNEKYNLEINGRGWPHGEWDLSLKDNEK